MDIIINVIRTGPVIEPAKPKMWTGPEPAKNRVKNRLTKKYIKYSYFVKKHIYSCAYIWIQTINTQICKVSGCQSVSFFFRTFIYLKMYFSRSKFLLQEMKVSFSQEMSKMAISWIFCYKGKVFKNPAIKLNLKKNNLP